MTEGAEAATSTEQRLPPLDGCVAMLLVVAIAVGRTALAPPSLWRDDAWVALVHRAPVGDALRMGVTSPGFALLLRLWMAVAGFSELRAQLPAFVAFAVTPAVLDMFARRLGLAWPFALLAGTLLVTSTPFVDVAARVKSYSTDALAAVVALWLAWEVVEEPASARRWLVFAAGAAVLTAVTSSVLPVVVSGFVVALLAAARAGALLRRPVLAAAGGYAAFAAVWWVTLISKATTRSLKVSFGGAMIPGRPGESRWAGIYARLTDLVGHVTPLAAHHVPGALVFLAAAVAIGSARRPRLTLLLVVPFAVAVVLALEKAAPLGGGGPITVNGSRIDVHLYPPLALLAAVGLADVLTVLSEQRLLHWRAAPVVAVALVGGLVLTAPRSSYPREDTKAFIRAAEEAKGPDDLLVIQTDARYQFGLYSRRPVHIVFSRRFESGFTVATSEPGVDVWGGGRTEDGNSDSAVLGLVPAPPPRPAPTNERVLVVSSAFYSAPTGVDDWLKRSGYRQAWQRTAPGAVYQEWLRR